MQLLFMSEYGFCPMNDYQDFCQNRYSPQGIRWGPLSESDCSSIAWRYITPTVYVINITDILYDSTFT